MIILSLLLIGKTNACEIIIKKEGCCIKVTLECPNFGYANLDFGDGSPQVKLDDPNKGIVHCYDLPGPYTIRARCFDPVGAPLGYSQRAVNITQEDIESCSDCSTCTLQTFSVDATEAPRAIWIQEYNDGINTNNNEQRCYLSDNLTSTSNVTVQNNHFVYSVFSKVKACYPDCDWSNAKMTWQLSGPIVTIEMQNWPVVFEGIFFISSTPEMVPIATNCN